MNQPEPQMVYLRQLRLELGIAQKELARVSGFFPAQISQWESGSRTIYLWQFEVLANALGLRVGLSPYSQA